MNANSVTGKSKFTPAQINWAMQHDWFIEVNPNGNVCGLERWSDGTNTVAVVGYFGFFGA